MSENELAISVRDLSKAYTIVHGGEKHSTLGEAMLARLRRPIQRMERETFWALKDVSFDVQRGEVVGIIGRNGAGKSTLLKILSRITQPTAGQIDLYGRVGSLLEVGTGFHQELTGRENIYLNGAILGMRKTEIQSQFDQIVDFAGVSQFLDTPVKRYSSGMYVRLAFAVAAHLKPEILIVDEVLSVGDMDFQNKCLGKMKDVATSGRTVLFVSHNMPAVRALCTRTMLLKSGSVVYDGPADEGIRNYLTQVEKNRPTRGARLRGAASPGAGIGEVRPAKAAFDPDEPKNLWIDLEAGDGDIGSMFLSVVIKDHLGTELVHCDSRVMGRTFSLNGHGRFLKFELRSPWLKPGDYRVDLALCTIGGVLDLVEDACRFSVSELLPYPAASTVKPGGIVLPQFDIELIPQRPELPVGTA